MKAQHLLSTAWLLLSAFVGVSCSQTPVASGTARTIVFDGDISAHKWTIGELDPKWPSDWSDYSYLVLEMRTSTPQRFSLWVYTANGPRRVMLQPFGQNVWLRAAVPLQYLRGRDTSGHDLASATNRRTDSFWMSVWGPFGDLQQVESIGFAMHYPINHPKVEFRSITLSKEDPGSDFLEGKPVLDEFGQWQHADWPRKIRSQEQLDRELAEEAAGFGPGNFGYCDLGGYTAMEREATGFFRVEQVDGKWWFIDPHGHPFISTGSNGISFWRRRETGPDAAEREARIKSRLLDWGLNTGAEEFDMPYISFVRLPRDQANFLGMPDVYGEEFAAQVDAVAKETCAPRKDDVRLIGYFFGNEPPWFNRESELADLILGGPDTATRQRLQVWLAESDTPERRKDFMMDAFRHYLAVIDGAIRRNDPNHITLGIRFGGTDRMPDEMLATGSVFDVCSINVYEYEPTKQVERAYRLTGRPILIGEFHFGAPADGLGAGLVQARDPVERGKAYRYYIEQAAALPGFVGAHWFTWRDEPVTGRGDGENYNIGFVDVTDRPYLEMVGAAKATNRHLFAVHSGEEPPFGERPLASDAGTPSSPWIDRTIVP